MSSVVFNPHLWHETRPWEGHRITVAAVAVYTIKAVKMLDLDDSETLKRLQLVLPA